MRIEVLETVYIPASAAHMGDLNMLIAAAFIRTGIEKSNKGIV
jgi:hypothetical protein